MFKFLVTVLGVAAVIYLIFLGYAYIFQSRLVYVPHGELVAFPGDVGLDYHEVYLNTSDEIRIHGWFVPAKDSREVVLFSHGNAGNISHRLTTLDFLHSLDMSTFIYDYRGYGKSQGSPDEPGTYIDARAAWEYLVQEKGFDPDDIFVMGRSLGGAIAAYLGEKERPAGIILESTFTSIPDMGRDLMPFLPVKLLSRYSYDTLSRLQKFPSPVLIIHSPQDEIVPYRHGRTLYAEAGEPKYFLEIQGDHNSGYMESRETYLNGLEVFFKKYSRHREGQ
ncbi:alpha/beta hydrolase [Desulfonatronospira sp.]|uniref:alpha/beta hydrolase n=1 Tax=Desulfonatronospira sp. TaxID=1962951 RepID=UPI0025C51E60|nr:alpha/beta hydrolase [Desulfonatronospira sp.]